MYYKVPVYILSKYLDTKVRDWCKECKRYEKSASCPPFIESLETYNYLFMKYEHAILIILKFNIDNPENWKELGRLSSESLRTSIQEVINKLNLTNYISFGGGSCKHCQVCSIPCKFPDLRLIPIEGLGINVIALVKDISNIELKFPVEQYGYFYRVGLVIWNEK